MNGLLDFLARRKAFTSEYFACPGSKKTVLISSYIWWTELMAYALLRLGYNVLVAEPWYGMYTDDARWSRFDSVYRQWIDVIKRLNVQLVIGGNSTISVLHPQTRQLLHREAGVPAVCYWWDEPRNVAPMVRRGFTANDQLACLKDDRTLNAIWDIDILQEMQQFYGVTNSIHVPLAASPDFWLTSAKPLNERPIPLCFLGNNHDEGAWQQSADPAVLAWARKVAANKLADLDRPMTACIDAAGSPASSPSATGSSADSLPLGIAVSPEECMGASAAVGYTPAASLDVEFSRWRVLDAVLVNECRNTIVRAAAGSLGDRFVLIGKGWDRIGLKAQREHSGVPAAKEFYAQSRASLNLFGGCVHGGMPLRPYEIAASRGLIFTQYNRELPDLFEPGKECVAFRSAPEMLDKLARLMSAPAEFDAVVEAGRKRVLAEHTWERRLETICNQAKARFDLPW